MTFAHTSAFVAYAVFTATDSRTDRQLRARSHSCARKEALPVFASCHFDSLIWCDSHLICVQRDWGSCNRTRVHYLRKDRRHSTLILVNTIPAITMLWKKLSVQSRDRKIVAPPARWHGSMRRRGCHCNYPFRCCAPNRRCTEDTAAKWFCLGCIMTLRIGASRPAVDSGRWVGEPQTTNTKKQG